MHGNTKLPKVLGKKIQRIRKSIKLTQGQLSEKVGISEVYMGFIEQGRYAPSLDILNKIAKALKVKPSELLP